MRLEAMTQAEMDRLTDEQLHTLERATQKLGTELQRQAAHYQHQADRMRKAIKARNRRTHG